MSIGDDRVDGTEGAERPFRPAGSLDLEGKLPVDDLATAVPQVIGESAEPTLHVVSDAACLWRHSDLASYAVKGPITV